MKLLHPSVGGQWVTFHVDRNVKASILQMDLEVAAFTVLSTQKTVNMIKCREFNHFRSMTSLHP